MTLMFQYFSDIHLEIYKEQDEKLQKLFHLCSEAF